MLTILGLIVALQVSPMPSVTETPAAAAPLPGPQPTDNAAVGKIAREQFYAFASGKVDATLYSMPIPKSVMPQVQAFLSALGPVKNVTLVQSEKMGESLVYVYKFTCENGATLEQLSIKDGKIDGIYFRPVQ